MKRLFLSLYLGLAASLVFFFYVAHWLNTNLIVDIENIIRAEQFTAEVELLERLEPTLSDDERQQALNQIAMRNQVIIEMVDKSAVPADILAKLEQQQVWCDDEEYDYFSAFSPVRYYRMAEDDDNELLDIDSLVGMAIYIALFVLIAGGSGAWLYLLQRKLRHLEQAAVRLSEGDFSARAPATRRLQVGSLNDSFNHMADRIEHLLASHRQLTQNVAHELRTPLFRMQIQAEMLAAASEQQRPSYLAGIEEDIFHLQELIDELMQYAKTERTGLSLNYGELVLAPLVAELTDKLTLEHSEPVEIQLPEEDIHFRADKALLIRALGNLLRNAIKYGKGRIRLTANASQSELAILVEDDGTGVDAADAEQIFEPFYRAGSHRGKIAGYGLGLAISREIIRLHGGELKLVDGSLGGAAFRVTLPFAGQD